MALNHVTLQGRLVKDIEVKTTQSGVPVTAFTIAVNRNFKDKDGKTEADFINCVAWRSTAEFMGKYIFAKGTEMILEGSIQVRTYTDNGGAKRWVTEVIADKVYFCGAKKDAAKDENPGYIPDAYSAPSFEEVKPDDDLPF